MDCIACLFCNATLTVGQLRPTGAKVLCPRCGEPLPAHLLSKLADSPSSPQAAEATPPVLGWSNRKIGLSILAAMFLMAAIGLTLALLTVESRRKNDYRVKRDTRPPPTVQAPGELAGLGFLPPDVTAPQGEGYVTYTVRPKATSPTGSVVNAKATIVFDTNAPLDTAPIFNTLDAGPVTSTVAPLLSIQQCDPAGSERIARYIVNGSGTVPRRKKPAAPAGSNRLSTRPPAISAFTWDATRTVVPSSA